ncbi:MAG: 3-deoxy-manno-octulosonate cytidylyltransferase [Myxococcales bacterium]|nr:3-deoxy-manno-octulosonate cytidylyltransferase [Myxococcales bacterium]
MNVTIVIPARYASTRFPGKPLAPLLGRPMILWVVERASAVHGAEVLVAADDERIARVVEESGGRAVRTRATHASGTDRVAEVALGLASEIVINLQGDEPLIEPPAVEALIAAFDDASVRLATLARRLDDEATIADPNVVKVVFDRRGNALYFSRSPIPSRTRAARTPIFQHVGIYGYRRQTLLELAGLPPSPLELAEGLEQLRALENGIPIRVLETPYEAHGIDTPGQLAVLEEMLRTRTPRV